MKPTKRLLQRSPATRAGSAVVTGLAILVVLGVLVVGFLEIAVASSTRTRTESSQYRMNAAAESVASLAISSIWSGFEQIQATRRTTPWDLRVYLDGLACPDQGGQADPAGVDVLGGLGLPTNAAGEVEMAGAVIESVRLVRRDQGAVTRLTVRTNVRHEESDVHAGRRGDIRKAFEQTYVVERGQWEGLDFALLANNVNCVMCHAEIDSADRFYNRSPANYDSYQRVKVGSLESIQLRSSSDSNVAGTLYLGGRAFEQDGAPITNWAAQTLKSDAFDGHGFLLEDDWGDLDPEDFSPADSTDPQPYENLYENYGHTAAGLVDGYFPTSFPSPFPDDGGVDPTSGAPAPGGAGNRVVDPSEFFAATRDADGVVTGGRIHVAAPGDVIDTAAELSNVRTTSNAATLGPVTTGNVVLTGSPADPIVLDGELAIEGDLVISGTVQGKGSFKVSGNVYIPDDLVYLDGVDANGMRTFGVDSNGDENALAIASGGNIMVGNVFHPRWGSGTVTGDETGSFSFIMDELAIFNRMEWTKTQPLLPAEGESLADPSSWSVTNPLYEGPAYLPRYYSFTEGGPVPIFSDGYFDPASRTWLGREHPGKWDGGRNFIADPADIADPYLYDAAGGAKAIVYSLMPSGGWMDDGMLRALLDDVMASRDDTKDLAIDGTLYSNNSIFGIVPTSARGPGTNGRVHINGGIVAADIGLLAPTKIRLNFDQRAKDLLDITADGRLIIRRELWAPRAP